METQRLKEMERRLKQLERRLQRVVAAWILSLIGMLMFGLMVRSAWSNPAQPPVLTVYGLKVVDEHGREHAAIDAKGEIKGSGIFGDRLAIGTSPRGPLFTVSSFAVPGGEITTRIELVSPDTGSSEFSVWTGGPSTDTRLLLAQGNPGDYVRVTPSGIKVGRGGRTVWRTS